jgi:hypothetical protein
MARPPDVPSDVPSPVRHRPRQEEKRPDAELRRARASRDAGLRRVSRLTGWIVAATIVLTGTLSEVAAHALPGHRKGVTPARSPQPQPSNEAVPAPSTDEGDQSSETPGLQAPEQAPAPSDATGGAVSGGS